MKSGAERTNLATFTMLYHPQIGHVIHRIIKQQGFKAYVSWIFNLLTTGASPQYQASFEICVSQSLKIVHGDN